MRCNLYKRRNRRLDSEWQTNQWISKRKNEVRYNWWPLSLFYWIESGRQYEFPDWDLFEVDLRFEGRWLSNSCANRNTRTACNCRQRRSPFLSDAIYDRNVCLEEKLNQPRTNFVDLLCLWKCCFFFHCVVWFRFLWSPVALSHRHQLSRC